MADPWLYVPILLSVVTLLLAILAAWRMPGVALSRGRQDELRNGLESISRMLNFAPAADMHGQASGKNSASSARLQSGVQDRSRERRISVEADPQLQLAQRVQDFSECLEEWCNYNRVPLSTVLVDEKRLRRWASDLEKPVKAAALQQIAEDFQNTAEDTLETALSKSDRDLDRKKNGRGQNYLEKLVAVSRVRLIDPSPGDAIDPRLHVQLGTRTPEDRRLRGTVADVATRGLERKDGKVIVRAEVYEYD